MRLSRGGDVGISAGECVLNATHVFLFVVVLAAVTVSGDYFLKMASQEHRTFQNWWFIAGCLTHALTAFGWVLAMKHVKLANIGVVYSLSTVLLLAALGVFAFGETLNRYEVGGIVLAILSLMCLSRLAS